MSEILSIVIDTGTATCKVGFAGDDKPHTVFETIVGRPRQGLNDGFDYEDYYVGEAARLNEKVLDLTSPRNFEKAVNWEDMECVWHHTFYSVLKVDPKEHPIVLTEWPLNPRANRGRMGQIMFETFNVAAVYINEPAPLALYSTGNTTGLVLDIGDSFIHAVPVHEGCSLHYGIVRADVAGKDLDKFMVKLLAETGYNFGQQELVFVKDIKEKFCYVALDYEKEKKTFSDPKNVREYKIPDGTNISVGVERIKCTEAFFQPGLIGKKVGIHDAIYKSVKKCDCEIKNKLFSNICLAGGNSIFPGIERRIRNELLKIVPDKIEISFITSPEKKFAAWKGGSILASVTNFEQMYISKEEYDESGPGLFIRGNYF